VSLISVSTVLSIRIGVALSGFLLSCWWEYLFPFAGKNWWAMLLRFNSFMSVIIFGLFVAGGCVGVLEV